MTTLQRMRLQRWLFIEQSQHDRWDELYGSPSPGLVVPIADMHGTESTYINRGCRCYLCRAARGVAVKARNQ